MPLGSPFFEQLNLKKAQNVDFGSLCNTLVLPSKIATVKTATFLFMRNFNPKSSGCLCVLKFIYSPT